jgi:hydroxypyruvate isomerase
MSFANQGLKPALTKWCLMDANPQHWPLEKICQVAQQLQVEAVEVVGPEDFPILKKYGLVSALTTAHWFVKCMNNRLFWKECLAAYRTSIDANAELGYKNVISFWGFGDTTAEGGSRVDLEEGKRNLIEGYKQIVGYAEKKNVTLVLESLNTRDGADMKGHPGYQGDRIEDCLEVIKAVGSPNLKLLFDFYHVQIMSGDIIRRIEENKEYIGYVQAAGVPGRNELDEDQELNFSAILKAFATKGYKGYVGLEFIPAKEPLESLTKAVNLFNV